MGTTTGRSAMPIVGSVVSVVVALGSTACGASPVGGGPVTLSPEQVAGKVTASLESQAGHLPGSATCQGPLLLRNGESTHCIYVAAPAPPKHGKAPAPSKQVGLKVDYVSGDTPESAQVQIEPDGTPE
jgi:hypothetical protein